MTLLEFVPQCCDAGIYLKMGKQCAEQGICYNGMRPMGAVYWFSLPYRLGLPPASLILGHYVLLGLSALLSVLAARRIRHRQFAVHTTPRMFGVLLLCSLALHTVFLYPVLHASLSDAPASLSALLATWLLLLAPERGKSRMAALLGAGLALGFAAWMRAFFLYPVLITLGIWPLLQLLRQKWQWGELVLLTALIPIAIQYAATFNTSRQFSYLAPDMHEGMYHEHIESLYTGYDTILPFDYHTTYAACDHYRSLPDALQHLDLYSLACLWGGRLYFYFGSYSAYPYLPPFEHKLPEVILADYHPLSISPDTASGSRVNLVLDPARSIQFVDEQNQPQQVIAHKFWKPEPQLDARLTQTLYLERGNIYRLRAMLWSEHDIHHIHLIIAEHDSQKIVADSGALLTPFNKPNLPNPSFTEVRIDKNALYDVAIASSPIDETSLFGKAAAEMGMTFNTGALYIWDVSLAKIPLAQPATRHWSLALLLFNSLAALIALVLIQGIIAKREPLAIMALLLPLLSLGASLCILPEQRFVIYPLITFGLLTLTWITRRSG